MRIRKTVGIDLGTTNSVIALLDPTDSTIITGQDEQGRKTIPSVVAYESATGCGVVGRSAVALKDQSEAPVRSVKRFMGLDRPFAVGPDTLTPPEVSARILSHLRDALARTLNDGRYLLDSAIITMPAYFNYNQIEATRQAGERAGFEVVELLHEPTAAAIYYSWVAGHGDATYLVYDLGGGTFDVSIIRKRLGDYEVLSVSGDPFLGGDDFDRLLASELEKHLRPSWTGRPACGPGDAANFARLVHAAEGIKIELSERERVCRYVPDLLGDDAGAPVSLEADINRDTFNRLIKDKIDRTIQCCHEALGRAREKAGVRLSDIDYVILAGGSTRIPLVRQTVRAALCNPELPEHVRHPEPLLHEPDLCVAHGAALRAASYGTRYLVPVAGEGSASSPELELHLTSPLNAQDIAYQLTGVVRPRGNSLDTTSVRIRALATGLTEEAFLDERGSFCQELELLPDADNPLELAVCDGLGRELVRLPACVRHQGGSRPLGPAVLPTQLITKPLQIEVLSRGRQRVKQVVAPVGATLPGTFACTCRTLDRSGRVVVPIYEENRLIKEMVLENIDPALPVGSPVEVELEIDARHNIQVRVRVREAGRCESAYLAAPAPPRRPTRADIEEVRRQIEALLPEFSGSYRTRVQARMQQLLQDLHEALRYEDEPKAIQRLAELRELLEQMEANRGQVLDPPWPRFGQLVKSCLHLAADMAEATQWRDRDDLFAYIHAQERYAEQAFEERNQTLYRECWDNLTRYAGYLDQLRRDALPRPEVAPTRSPEEEAREGLEHFRGSLSAVWKQVRAARRAELEARLQQIAGQGKGLLQRLKSDAPAVVRDLRRLLTEVHKVEQCLRENHSLGPGDTGLLEGTL
jgi:molecular chaperone DnaK